MAQYGGDQQHRQEVRQTVEHENPNQTLEEHETLVQSDTGGQYQREVRRTDEHGTTVRKTGGTTGDYGSRGQGNQGLGTNIGHALGGTGTGTDNISGGGRTTRHQGQGNRGVGKDIGHADVETGMEYTPEGRSLGQTGYQGLGTEPGSHGGTMGDYGSTRQNQGLGQRNRGTSTNIGHAAGRTGTDTNIGHAVGRTGTDTNIGHAVGRTGTDYNTSSGRSVGQTGYQGLGTEPTTEAYDNPPGATRLGGVGTGTGGTHDKKGMMDKIKEKLPGHHD